MSNTQDLEWENRKLQAKNTALLRLLELNNLQQYFIEDDSDKGYFVFLDIQDKLIYPQVQMNFNHVENKTIHKDHEPYGEQIIQDIKTKIHVRFNELTEIVEWIINHYSVPECERSEKQPSLLNHNHDDYSPEIKSVEEELKEEKKEDDEDDELPKYTNSFLDKLEEELIKERDKSIKHIIKERELIIIKDESPEIIECFMAEAIPILEEIKEERDQLSYYISDEDYLNYLNHHLEILKAELFKIEVLLNKNKILNPFVVDDSPINLGYYFIPITPYEQRILKIVDDGGENYLNSIERLEEIRIRCKKYRYRLNYPTPFIDPCLIMDVLFLPLEEIVDLLFFSGNMNIVFIPLNSNKKGREHTFFKLSRIVRDENTGRMLKYWTMDPHLSTSIKILSERILYFGGELLKPFIHDWKGNLNYTPSLGFDYTLHISEERRRSLPLPVRFDQYFQVFKNMVVSADEFYLGQILRSKIIDKATYFMGIDDRISSFDDDTDLAITFKLYHEKLKRGLPPLDKEPTTYLNAIFDDIQEWSFAKSNKQYIVRYKNNKL